MKIDLTLWQLIKDGRERKDRRRVVKCAWIVLQCQLDQCVGMWWLVCQRLLSFASLRQLGSTHALLECSSPSTPVLTQTLLEAIHTYVYTYIHACMHACIHTYAPGGNTYIVHNIHTSYIDTWIHKYIDTRYIDT
jgi:hypothetical protein